MKDTKCGEDGEERKEKPEDDKFDRLHMSVIESSSDIECAPLRNFTFIAASCLNLVFDYVFEAEIALRLLKPGIAKATRTVGK